MSQEGAPGRAARWGLAHHGATCDSRAGGGNRGRERGVTSRSADGQTVDRAGLWRQGWRGGQAWVNGVESAGRRAGVGRPVSGGVRVKEVLLGGGSPLMVRRATRGPGGPAVGGSRESPQDLQLARQSIGGCRRQGLRGGQARVSRFGSAGRRAGVGRPALESRGGAWGPDVPGRGRSWALGVLGVGPGPDGEAEGRRKGRTAVGRRGGP